jgi:heme-degrading monooxygenase HmoA
MIGLFFEVQTKPGHRDQYLGLAASLKPDLETMGGCLFIDRFRSLKRGDVLLSHQVWQDEGTLTAWRAHAGHHDVQTIGRERVFADYRIRVAQVIHEQRPGEPAWRPERRTPYNDPARRKPTYMLTAESARATLPVESKLPCESFASVYRERHFAHLIDLTDEDAGAALGPRLFADSTVQYVRVFEVMRDYGMYERKEAPQYYPPVARTS